MSHLLKRATADIHRHAERRPFVRSLINGDLPLGTYGAYIAALVPVYAALEDGLSSATASPALARFGAPALRRTERLMNDLEALRVGGEVPLAGLRYAAHIRAMTAANPWGLVGHAYCRYMGDLAGGQLIGRRARALGVPDHALSAHRFDEAPPVLMTRFRRDLDALNTDVDQRSLIEREAIRSFEMSVAIFNGVPLAHSASDS